MLASESSAADPTGRGRGARPVGGAMEAGAGPGIGMEGMEGMEGMGGRAGVEADEMHLPEGQHSTEKGALVKEGETALKECARSHKITAK